MMLFLLFLNLIITSFVWGAEQELNLDEMPEVVSQSLPAKNIETKFNIMGRLDLTAEINPIKNKSSNNRSELKNLHGLKLFLKLKASPKTSFFGEIANQDFYAIDFKNSDSLTSSLGKILVPFGDTRYFHHFYGGVQGLGSQGVFFQNVWAEPGIITQWKINTNSTLETYIINGFKSSTELTFPDLKQVADTNRQAIGARYQWQGINHLTMIGSVYFDNYWENRQLTIMGGDIYSDYGLLDIPIRFSAGFVNGSANKIPQIGTINRRGDYLQLAGLGLGSGELRFRYGTYNHIVAQRSALDTHSFEIGYMMNVDVLRILFERQWNFEEQDEVESDVLRVMASLDF